MDQQPRTWNRLLRRLLEAPHGDGRPPLLASADPRFRGDAASYNAEDPLVASLSGCHMLWYLHLCAVERLHVVAYVDPPEGRMVVRREGDRFAEVVLRPRVHVADPSMVETAEALHDRAQRACFIASSVNFLVRHEPEVSVRPYPTEQNNPDRSRKE